MILVLESHQHQAEVVMRQILSGSLRHKEEKRTGLFWGKMGKGVLK